MVSNASLEIFMDRHVKTRDLVEYLLTKLNSLQKLLEEIFILED